MTGKRWIALLLALLMLFSLAACGQKPSPAEDESREPSRRRPVPTADVGASSAALEERYDERTQTLSYVGAGVDEGELYMRVPAEEDVVDATGADTPALRYVDRELIALAAVGADENKLAALFGGLGLDIVGYNALCGSYQLRSRDPVTEAALLALRDRLAAEPELVGVFFNTVSDLDVDAYPLPDDPWDGERVSADAVGGANWGVEAIRAPWFWQNYDLRGVRVGVIDNMFAASHADLGFAAVYHNNYSSDADRWYHGTHVAGIIGARHDDKGVSGVLKSPLLYATDWDGSEFSRNGSPVGPLNGYLLKIGVMLTNGARVINFSIGYNRSAYFDNGYSAEDLRRHAVSDGEAMARALQGYLERGWDFVLVNAAGNDNVDAFDNWWLTAVTDEQIKSRIVVVGSVDLERASGAGSEALYTKRHSSNFGPRLDVVAPGGGIFSCVQTRSGVSDYESHSGTSMAAPFVTAACAALWAYYPALSGADVKALLVETADIPVSGFDAKMIDLEAAFGGLAEGELANHAQMGLQEILAAYREAVKVERRQGLSDISVVSGRSQYADVDFDGLQDLVSVSGGSRLTLTVDFGSGARWQAEMTVDNDGETPTARLLSFTDGDYLCYAFISENLGSKYRGLYCQTYGQDYLHRGEIVPLSLPDAMELDSWGGVYDNRWVVVVNTRAGGFSRVYGIPDELHEWIRRSARDYGGPQLPIPSAEGMCYEIYAAPRADGDGRLLVLSRSCISPLGYSECPGTVYAAYHLLDASHASAAQVWFEEDSYYLYPLTGVTPDMVSRDLTLKSTAPIEDGEYRAILYAVDDAYGSHVSSEIDIEDYMYFSREEIAALRVGDTLEMSRFTPDWMVILYRAYGEFSDGYEDVTVQSIESEYDEWLGSVIYINRGDWDEVILQDWNGGWRVADEAIEYVPMQIVQTVTLSFAPDIRIYDYFTPLNTAMEEDVYLYEWTDPYDFFVFNDLPYYEAIITVADGVITEMTIPYHP